MVQISMPDQLSPTGSIPSSGNNAGGQAGIDEINRLLDQQKEVQSQILATTQQAVQGVAGKTSATPNLGQVPTINAVPGLTHPTYSRSATQSKGIANIVLGAAGIVGKVEQYHLKNEQQNLATHLENVLKYTDGMNQAQNILASDPNNAEAKKVLDQNQQNLDALLSDPKMRKKIAKAFDISFSDPSQNNKPEHAAMNQAAQSYAQQLQSKMPASVQPNVTAQNKLQILQAQQNATDAQIKATIPIVTRQITEENANQRTQFTQESANQRAQLAADQRHADSLARIQSENTRATAANKTRLEAASITARASASSRVAVAQINQNGAYNRTMDALNQRYKLLNSANLSPEKKAQTVANTQRLLQSAITTSNNNINQWQQLLKAPGTTPEDKANYEGMIRNEQSILQQYQDQTKELTTLSAGETNNGKSSNSTSSTQTGSGPAKVVGPADDSSDDDRDFDAIINSN